MNEQVRHRAVQALEGEPGKVARAGADTAQRHLGHALGGKAGNEAVAQVAHAADVDVAHRVVVSTRKDGEEMEVLRSSLHEVVWVLQAAQLHLRLQEAILLPGHADGRGAPGTFPEGVVQAAGGLHHSLAPLSPGGQAGAAGVPLRALGTWRLPLPRLVNIARFLLSAREWGSK